jgi:hypothetical protein
MPPVVVVDTVTHGVTNGPEHTNQFNHTHMDAITSADGVPGPRA